MSFARIITECSPGGRGFFRPVAMQARAKMHQKPDGAEQPVREDGADHPAPGGAIAPAVE